MITYPLNNIEYSAEDAELYTCTRSSGVFSGDDFTVTCTGTNNNVTVGVGVGWIHNTRFSGKVFANKTAETLKLSVADAIYPRIDVVAIRFDASANSTSFMIKEGEPAEEPALPDIVQTDSVYELYLASVYREAGAASVTQDNITDIRLDESVCGLMRDGVTAISTKGLQLQYYAVLAELRAALDRVRDSGTSAEFIPISDATAAALGIASGSSVDNSLNALKSAIDNKKVDGGDIVSGFDILADAIGAAKIQTGSYVGTGTKGSSNPCTLTFDGQPVFVAVFSEETQTNSSRLKYGGVLFIRNAPGRGLNESFSAPTTQWGENSLSWYSGDVEPQQNVSKATYHWFAILV